MDASLVDKAMTIIHDLKSKNIILNEDGIFDKRAQEEWKKLIHGGNGNYPDVPFTREQVEQSQSIAKAIKIIPFLVLKTTRKGLVGSYGLKHLIEDCITTTNKGSYMTNGEAILAMLLLDYTIILSKEGSLNCTFHCQYVKNDNKNRGKNEWQKI